MDDPNRPELKDDPASTAELEAKLEVMAEGLELRMATGQNAGQPEWEHSGPRALLEYQARHTEWGAPRMILSHMRKREGPLVKPVLEYALALVEGAKGLNDSNQDVQRKQCLTSHPHSEPVPILTYVSKSNSCSSKDLR